MFDMPLLSLITVITCTRYFTQNSITVILYALVFRSHPIHGLDCEVLLFV
ncbi:hypothetical protein RchiOBHm_Chr1g0361801 [Rosa chinensis]|uniref:Uncharacterized protein n=1 Tax=Rosa chinensis TaxID=74649 RepID=A0A2P6SJ30_ROSCH|nr:hypothetical protein RchiOBHm_Chr1g0361801 [Rosa chinensis]